MSRERERPRVAGDDDKQGEVWSRGRFYRARDLGEGKLEIRRWRASVCDIAHGQQVETGEAVVQVFVAGMRPADA